MTVRVSFVDRVTSLSLTSVPPDSKPFSSKVIALKVDPLEQATQAVTDLVVLTGSKKDQVPSGYCRLP